MTPATSCDRFESEALVLLEQGLPLGEHFSTCPDCLAARAAYDRLRTDIAAAGEAGQPPLGWQASVWATIEERRERRSRWRRWLVPVGVGVAAMAASVAAVFLLRPPAPEIGSLRAEVEAGTSVRRGTEAKPGDVLRLTAVIGNGRDARHAELRVYRNDSELILSCSTESPCFRRGKELRATLVLDGIGRYQPLLLLSRSPLPPASSDLEKDTSAAFAAGAEVKMGTEVAVR
jgi:hypothetical protein